jgi:hypothetical protein
MNFKLGYPPTYEYTFILMDLRFRLKLLCVCIHGMAQIPPMQALRTTNGL